jgi:DNA-binding CsgD family transcriptional regulator
MAEGIRATVEFSEGDICPIARLSGAAETSIDGVSVNVCPPVCGRSISEFSIASDIDVCPEFERVFAHGGTSRLRLVHDGDESCPCEQLGVHGCPVDRYHARNGTLTVAFYVPSYDRLRAVIADLRERFDGVDLKRLIRSPVDDRSPDGVFVDRGRLTDRQLEVLKTAYGMGYFERPRRANAMDVAERLGVDPSTFSEHLSAAQRKLLGDVLEISR